MDVETEIRLIQEGIRLHESGDFPNARAIFKSVSQENRSFAPFFCYAAAAANMGDRQEALDALSEALAFEPGNIQAYNLKLDLHKALSQHREVIACVHELMAIDPSRTDLILVLSEAYNALGNSFLSDRQGKAYLRKIYHDNPAIEQLNIVDTRYHLNYIKARNSHFRDYPRHVHLETFAKCNAACSFCVYPDLVRKGTQMPMALIDKIIADLQEIPPDVTFQLSPLGVNEPFLDKRIFEVLDKISTKLPNATITLTSNASPITDAILRKLSRYKLGYLWLSVVDYRKEVYEEKMKLPFERLLARLELIHQAKAEGWFKPRVVMSRLTDHSEHDARYTEFFQERFPLFENCLWPYANWIGGTKNEITSPIADIPCGHWLEIRIGADGIVQHCCMDGQAEYPWGDVRTNSVLEIYNQEKYRRLRTDTFSRLDVVPCNGCNLR